MITVSCLNDLRQFGIDPLTGEADALSYRILCDLTAAGRRIVAEALSLKLDGFQENWNSGDKADPHVASIMLDHYAHLWIGPVALCTRPSVHTVLRTESTLYGLQQGEEFITAQSRWSEETQSVEILEPAKWVHEGLTMRWPSVYGEVQRIFSLPRSKDGGQQVSGTRNVHAFSGRAV